MTTLQALRRLAWLLDEIRAGNAYSEDLLWREITRARDVIARAEASTIAQGE